MHKNLQVMCLTKTVGLTNQVLRLPGAFFKSSDQRLTTALPGDWRQ
jgi:hypothetical protein